MQVSCRSMAFSCLLLALWLSVAVSAEAQEPEPAFTWTYLDGSNASPGSDDEAVAVAIDEMRRRQILEGIASDLNLVLHLPETVVMSLQPCSEPSAFYEPAGRRIVVCGELLALAFAVEERELAIFSRMVGADSAAAMMWDQVASELEYLILHEVGHAIVDVRDLPVIGREEDAADQFSVFLPAYAQDVNWLVRIATGAGQLLTRLAEDEMFSREAAGREHPLSQQRVANVACWTFGHLQLDGGLWPNALAEGVTEIATQNLPASRLGRCASEYARLYEAWASLAEQSLR